MEAEPAGGERFRPGPRWVSGAEEALGKGLLNAGMNE